ncbi:hypothetical protein An07g00410 [Aspergillus niger]|uniref:Uncharacterized protein n=2 Tax=Aspergillus niger TaxID=5061 RepID=A2QM11_ASPNC|nr:hypothetical protein An07g00410 [Aspergillus niger]CAK39265.1 hypothetical protein An07g00410 [Aspergillus niger]
MIASISSYTSPLPSSCLPFHPGLPVAFARDRALRGLPFWGKPLAESYRAPTLALFWVSVFDPIPIPVIFKASEQEKKDNIPSRRQSPI